MGEKSRTVICDTNILFDLLKGNTKVKTNLERIGNENIAFTIITQAEAYCGSGKDELKKLKSFFAKYKTYHLDSKSSEVFMELVHAHHQRHSKWIPDALIAATAINNNLELYTLNTKDFKFIKNLKLYKP